MNTGPRVRGYWGFPLAVCGVFLVGCGPAAVFQDQVDPACLEPAWMADVVEAIDVAAETFRDVLAHVLLEVPLVDGDWADDFGDARFYGPAVLLGLGHQIDSPCLLAFGRAALEGNRRLIRRGRDRWMSFWLNVPDQLMAAHGLVETHQHEHQDGDVGLIDAVLDRLNAALEVFDLYPDALADSLMSNYGPTTETAGVVALNLRYALRIGGDRGPERQAFGLRVIDAVNERVFDVDRGIYLFSSRTTDLHLYPNTMMITANCLAYESTGQARYLERARATFDNIQSLKDPDRHYYRSPYGAAFMGAQTDDYSSLSSQLYLIIALDMLGQHTGQQRYRQEALDVLDFVCTHLRQDGRLLHHWMDGQPARPDDAVDYCSGCNLQALYVMWTLSQQP